MESNNLSISEEKRKVFFGTKGKVITEMEKITLQEKDINIVKEMRFLGVIIDENLKWVAHSENLAKKLS